MEAAGRPRFRVLVIEDEVKVAEAIRQGLVQERYEVTLATSGDDGLRAAEAASFDLMILDLMLPGQSGLEILSILRGRGVSMPVLILTARDGLDDRLRGLDEGADDYLAKPFALPELLARMRALLRRARPIDGGRLTVGDLELDLIARRVTRAGRVIDLTTREFDFLAYLLRHVGQLVSREMLARDLWRDIARGTPLDNVIDVHLARLRRKVDHGPSTKLLHTVRGLGLMLRDGEP